MLLDLVQVMGEGLGQTAGAGTWLGKAPGVGKGASCVLSVSPVAHEVDENQPPTQGPRLDPSLPSSGVIGAHYLI